MEKTEKKNEGRNDLRLSFILSREELKGDGER
jgi:hypothetical protein